MRWVAPACVVAAALATGCGGSAGDEPLTVAAASSLKAPLTDYRPDARYSFAGSDQLAGQIRAGARPDVFVAANAELPEGLYDGGLVERPVVFASNRLVVAVHSESRAVGSLEDLTRPGVRIAIGSPTVPAGKYAREVLGKLPRAQARAILANVRSSEPDVAGVVGKLAQGAVDAGFVYASDVTASSGRLRAITLPVEAHVAYAAAVVKGSERSDAARDFVAGLRVGDGAEALERAGFLPPSES